MYNLIEFTFKHPTTGELKRCRVISVDRRPLSSIAHNIFSGGASKELIGWFKTIEQNQKNIGMVVSGIILDTAETVEELKQSKHYIDNSFKRWVVINGEYFESISAASKEINVGEPTISKAIKNKQKSFKSKGLVYILNEYSTITRSSSTIKIDGVIYKSASMAENLLGMPRSTLRRHLRMVGCKGSFTYKGKEYQFECPN